MAGKISVANQPEFAEGAEVSHVSDKVTIYSILNLYKILNSGLTLSYSYHGIRF